MRLPAIAWMDQICLAVALPLLASEVCGSLDGIARQAGISSGDAAVATLNANTSNLLLAVFMCTRAPSLIIYIPKPAGIRFFTKFYGQSASLALHLAEEYVSRDVRTGKARRDCSDKNAADFQKPAE